MTAELNAKITAKHNTKMKALHGKPSSVYYNNNHKTERHETKFKNKSMLPIEQQQQQNVEIISALTPPIDHDVENRLTASKISISAFKSSNNSVNNLVQPLLHPVHMQRVSSTENSLQRH